MSKDEQLRREAAEEVNKYRELVEQDPYRLKFHLMPPVGLLNDPNGFIHWKGTYHLFYQWMPFKTGHGAKFWGHYSSTDLVNWTHEEIALTPSEWFEKNGCYSGSAIDVGGKLHIFYTGNVKDEAGNRETYQCLAISEDGIHFDKKGPVVHLPKMYTAHFRDPKVWKQDGKYFMVIGAQTADLKGAIALFSSETIKDWHHEGILTGGGKGILGDFGYMFECPDLFHVDGQDILIFSPQGVEPEGMKYHNIYQAGYVVGKFDGKTGTYEHGEFEELDRGFDFYAPQTTEDEHGRRLLFAWMSVPDQFEHAHPTVPYRWLHNMTIPRELKVVEGKLWQMPVKELESLRVGNAIEQEVVLKQGDIHLEGNDEKAFELVIEDIAVSDGWFSISIGANARIVYSKKQGVITLERQSYVDGVTEKRQCELTELSRLHIFVDTSSIEVFVNGGKETFTARFYPAPNQNSILIGASGESKCKTKIWSLAKQ